VTPAGERLDRLCRETIEDLKRTSPMRGMQRLASLTEALTKQIDERADAVADRIQKAHDRGTTAIGKFEGYAAQVEKNADEIEKALGQISNMPPLESGDSGKSQPDASGDKG
jgi:hypothetical protein